MGAESVYRDRFTEALAGGTAALVMQNWSCGYYLLYFAPFAPLFVVHRMWAVGTLRSLRTWAYLLVAAVVTLALTLPFLLPYSEAQQRFGFPTPVRGSRHLLRQRLVLRRGIGEPVAVWQDAALLPPRRGRNLYWLRPMGARGSCDRQAAGQDAGVNPGDPCSGSDPGFDRCRRGAES